MKQNWNHIKKVLSHKKYATIAIVSALALGAGITYLTNFSLIRGNLGDLFAFTYIGLNGAIAILFGAYLALLIQSMDEKKAFAAMTATGFAGASASMLVTGCPACSVTLASFIGLGGLVAVLPFSGLELNVLGVGLLGYSIKKITDPKTCSIKR
jgi:hypothetical protein